MLPTPTPVPPSDTPEPAALVLEYHHLVPNTVRRFLKQDESHPLPRCFRVAALDLGDLHGVGYVGLMKAAEQWRPDRGSAFPSFAIERIRFAL